MFLMMIIFEMDIFPVDISSIITSYYTCSHCSKTYDRIRNLLHCGYLQAHDLNYFIKFYTHNNEYFLKYKMGPYNIYNLPISLDSIITILTHRLSFEFARFISSFSTQNIETHNTLSTVISAESKMDILLLIIVYQVFRCPALLKFINNMKFSKSLKVLHQMNSSTINNSKLITHDISQSCPSLCPPSCPHYMNLKLTKKQSIYSILGIKNKISV